MDTNTMEAQATIMEIDGDSSAMDTNDEGVTTTHDAWKESEPLDMNAESAMTDMPGTSAPFAMSGSESPQKIGTRVWTLPEGTCYKRTVRRGEGLCGPMRGADCTVTLHLISHSAGDDVVDRSCLGYALGQSSVQLGEGPTPLSCLIDSALVFMKKGETAEVGFSGVNNLEGELVLQVTLHDFTAVTPSWQLSPGEKCASAAAHKEKGAQLFKEGNTYAAFAQFRSAIRLLLAVLPYHFIDDEATGKSHQQLLCQCYLNLAACQMKTGHHDHVVTNCTQVLNLDPCNVKALYRRASANVSLGNYLLAHRDLETGLRREPHNRALLDLIQSVNTELTASESQMAQGLSKMFT